MTACPHHRCTVVRAAVRASLAAAGLALALEARAQDAGPDTVETIQLEPSAAPAAGDDVVQSIGGSEPSLELPALPPPPAAASEEELERFELAGWARQILEYGLASQDEGTAGRDPYGVPYDALIARTQLLMRARYARGQHFEANVSGFLSYDIFETGPADANVQFNGVNGDSVRGVVEGHLRELYVGLFTSHLDLRLGQQRVAWGRAEFLSPNDILNARDMRDPFLAERELRIQPTPMIRADIDFGFGSLQGVFAPVFIPDRFDAFGSNWSGVQPRAPRELRGFFGLARRSFDPTITEQVKRLLQATRLPAANFTQPTAGARLAFTLGDLDLDFYYQYGFDGPFVDIDSRLLAALSATDFDSAGLTSLEPLLRLYDAGEQPIRVEYVRRHHVGMDVAFLVGSFAIRIDSAFQSKRALFQRNLLSTTTPALQSVLSIEYQTGDIGKLVLVELMHLHLFDVPERSRLLIWDEDSFGMGLLVRWPVIDPLSFEVTALIGLQPQTLVTQPILYLTFGAWSLGLGLSWLDGEPYSFGDYFHRNREVFLKLKVAF